jgi:hypothetical protein
MKKKNLYIVVLLGVIFIAGCDKGFEGLNENPNDAISVPSGLLTADIVRVAMNSSYSTFVGGDMGACWAQHWAKVNYEDEERYKVRPSVIEDLVWKNYYESVISDAKTMQDLAIQEGNDCTEGVALVLQAYGYSYLTDLFGSIPFSQAINASILSPKYDEQEDVYAGIFRMLDKADSLFTVADGSITESSDLIYAGSVDKWQKFANSLKFRCLMRVSARVDVSNELQDIVDNRSVFESNDDEAKLVYLTADPNANPIFESIVYGNRFEYKVNSKLVNMLVDLNDPRLPVYVQKNKDNVYRGKPSGINDVPSDEYNYDNVSAIGTKYLTATEPGYFMSYSELLFLMAEARQKDLITTTATASDYYLKAIEANFEINEVSDFYASYIANPKVSLKAGDEGLQQIAEQNWLALFCQGIEAWTETRRTGFPVLTPAIDNVLNDKLPYRFTYPVIEQSVNAANYDAAVVSLGGPDLLTTKVWWMPE